MPESHPPLGQAERVKVVGERPEQAGKKGASL
jgi:hypothetical protein